MKVAANYHRSLLLCSVEQIFGIWASGLCVTDGHSALAVVSVCLQPTAAVLEVAAWPPAFYGPRKDHALPWVETSLKQASRGCKGWNLKHLSLPVRSSLGLEVIVTWAQKEKLNIVNLSSQNAFFATQNYMYLHKCLWLCNSNCRCIVIHALSFLFNH